jgi:hypothetical protein
LNLSRVTTNNESINLINKAMEKIEIDNNTIVCKYERGTGFEHRDVYRIIQSKDIKRYWEGRTLDFGNMEIATRECFKIILLP